MMVNCEPSLITVLAFRRRSKLTLTGGVELLEALFAASRGHEAMVSSPELKLDGCAWGSKRQSRPLIEQVQPWVRSIASSRPLGRRGRSAPPSVGTAGTPVVRKSAER